MGKLAIDEMNRTIKSESYIGRDISKDVRATWWAEVRRLKAKVVNIDRSIRLNPNSKHLTLMRQDRQEIINRINAFISDKRSTRKAVYAVTKTIDEPPVPKLPSSPAIHVSGVRISGSESLKIGRTAWS